MVSKNRGSNLGNQEGGLELGEGRELPREIVEKIEEAPLHLTEEKVILLLVKAGIKPAGIFEIYGNTYVVSSRKENNIPEDYRVPQDKIGSMKKLFDELGLEYTFSAPDVQRVEQRSDDSDQRSKFIREMIHINVAADKEHLHDVDIAGQQHSNEKLGAALGFPDTAIKAFNSDEHISKNDLPEEVKSSEYYPFIMYGLSKENWKEEIKTAELWAETVKKNSSKLFHELLAEDKDSIFLEVDE